MAALSDFLRYVLPYVPGCSDMMAEQHIRDVCIDFCAQTGIARQTLDPVSVTVGTDTYDFDPPFGSVVHVVLDAWLNERRLTVVTPDARNMPSTAFNSQFEGASTSGGEPRALLQKDSTSYTLVPSPATARPSGLTLYVALKPSRTSESVPDILLNDYAYEIGQGVAARLMRMPKQSFSDPRAADDAERNYIVGRNAALLRARNSFGRVDARVDIRSI